LSSMDTFKETFKEEAQELLISLEGDLLELERDPKNAGVIASIFRTMHTIKGSSAMFGFDEIAEFTHDIENVFDQVRNGAIQVDQHLIDITLESRDLIREMIEDEGKKGDRKGRVNSLLNTFKRCMVDEESAEASTDVDESDEKEMEKEESEEESFRIRFIPPEDLFLSGTNPIFLLQELQELGDCTIVPRMDRIKGIERFNPEKCYCSWDIIITTKAGLNSIQDVFIFLDAESELSIDKIETYDDAIEDESFKRLGEILVERGAISEDFLGEALGNQKKLGQVLVETKQVSSGDVESALQEQEHTKRVKERRQSEKGVGSSTIRVGSDKLDYLVDLVGELVTVQARISQLSGKDEMAGLRLVSEQLERLVEELRDNTMSLRMVPIGTTFNSYRRLVRDLSRDLGKKVELETEGAETELDKTMIERLGDPLVHLIRNSIDHGVESPEKRRSMGKAESGLVKLSARHVGATVQITVSDDGSGLDRDRIYRKAVEKGIVQEDIALSDDEVYMLIFEAGFSTAPEVSSVSGRGVGMDVVKKQIDALRGSVSVESHVGEGTRITLNLPLTLAIVDGLMVRVGEEFFIVPLSSVQACLEFNEDEHKEKKRQMVEYRERLLPYVRLDELFKIDADDTGIRQMVVSELDQAHFGIVVDEVIGDHQTVIKSLGPIYRDVEGISGATILGDGSIALILDILQLARVSKKSVAV
jgi:two-component system, chemotaxis family, sensor kinase CheA